MFCPASGSSREPSSSAGNPKAAGSGAGSWRITRVHLRGEARDAVRNHPGRPARWNIEPAITGTMEHSAGWI
jgi:hypothetical protein